MKKSHFVYLFFLTAVFSVNAQNFNGPSWLEPQKSLSHSDQGQEFVDQLIKKMTLKEMIGQLNLPSIGFDVTGPILSEGVEEKIDSGWVGGVFNTYTPIAVRKLQERAIKNTRLGIPLLLGYDVIHGHRTIFPIPLGLSSSWNPRLVKSSAAVAAKEATADGLNWTFSPMVDISRDPRWGRVSEGAGEDPYLGSIIGQSMVYGYQGESLRKARNLMACVKHFALYGAAEAGRDYNTVDMSRYRMENDYFPTYRAALQAGVGSVMTAFNDVNGMPSTCSKFLLEDILRNQWKFEGMVVTDYTAIEELMDHGLGNEKEVAEKAIVAGSEMDMVSELYLNHLESLARQNPNVMHSIQSACRNILLSKYRLGLFEDPYRGLDDSWQKDILSKEHRSIALRAAEESLVLLKNNNQLLPLKRKQKIAFVGPQIKRKRDLIGSWSGAGDWKKAVSIWEATEVFPSKRYAKGCNLIENEALRKQLNQHDAQIQEPSASDVLLQDAINVSRTADIIVLALGETFGMSGEAASMTQISLPVEQIALLKALSKLGKPIVTLLYNGRPMVLDEVLRYSDAVLECWFPGTEGGTAIVNTLLGRNNPSGKLTMTFPRDVGQIPIYYNHRKTGRPLELDQKYTSKYLNSPNTPQFPFGFGLSYSQFNYNKPHIDVENDTITIAVSVKNSSKVNGKETVQVYFRDRVASMTRPVKQLIRFDKKEIKAGKSVEYRFNIPTKDLGFYDSKGNWVLESGEFDIMLGPNSENTQDLRINLIFE